MKRLLPFSLLFLLQGCLYFNDTGVSAHLYDNCREYYDNCGIYHKECPPNLIDYKDVTERIKSAGKSLSRGIDAGENSSDSDGISERECVEPATITE